MADQMLSEFHIIDKKSVRDYTHKMGIFTGVDPI